MASATISNSGGPGSTIQLAPETIKVRDAVITRCEKQTLEQMNEFVKSLLANETDELKRLEFWLRASLFYVNAFKALVQKAKLLMLRIYWMKLLSRMRQLPLPKRRQKS